MNCKIQCYMMKDRAIDHAHMQQHMIQHSPIRISGISTKRCKSNNLYVEISPTVQHNIN